VRSDPHVAVASEGVGLSLVTLVILVPPTRVKVDEEVDAWQLNVDTPCAAAGPDPRVEQDLLPGRRPQHLGHLELQPRLA
jgi:hypothetical protein